jgi:hypothetical protein
MGTNYYFKAKAGELAQCGEIHIGKSSGGWAFSFQAYEEEGGERELATSYQGALRVKVTIPRLVIKSWAEWQAFLHATAGVIVDEYGSEISLDEFEELVRSLSPGQTWGEGGPRLLNHVDHLVENQHRYGKVDPKRDWKDAQGFSFCAAEFS